MAALRWESPVFLPFTTTKSFFVCVPATGWSSLLAWAGVGFETSSFPFSFWAVELPVEVWLGLVAVVADIAQNFYK